MLSHLLKESPQILDQQHFAKAKQIAITQSSVPFPHSEWTEAQIPNAASITPHWSPTTVPPEPIHRFALYKKPPPDLGHILTRAHRKDSLPCRTAILTTYSTDSKPAMRARNLATFALSLHALPRLTMHDSVAQADTVAVPAQTMQPAPTSRDALIRHYANFPDPSLTPDFRRSLTLIREKRNSVVHDASSRVSNEVIKILDDAIPHGLDSTMYRLRCACEEAAQRVENPLSSRLVTVANKVETFQARQRAHVTAVVEGFLPQDFRKTIFDTFRNRSERADADAVRELVENGGSVREKYQLLWQQQWRRREVLSSIGNASGIWKWLMRVLAGVPQPLLTFAREINAPNGPTEALRMKFGGVLTELADYAVEVNALVVAAEKSDTEMAGILADGLGVYEGEVDRFVELLEEVITESPFFVCAEEVEDN